MATLTNLQSTSAGFLRSISYPPIQVTPATVVTTVLDSNTTDYNLNVDTHGTGTIDQVVPPAEQLDVFEDEDTKIESVTANENAMVRTSDGVVVLIPVGALKSNDRMTIQKIAPTVLPGTLPGTVAGLVVDITLASGQTTFPMLLTIRLPYEDGNQDGIVDGTNPPINETDLTLWFFDTRARNWVQIPNTHVLPHDNVVVGVVDHLTTFGVFRVQMTLPSASAPTPTPTTPPTASAPVGGGGGGGGGCSLMPTGQWTLSDLLEALGNLLLPVLIVIGLRVWSWRRHAT